MPQIKHHIIAKFDWLMLFKEIIAVYFENNTKHINTKCKAVVEGSWHVQLPVGFKGLNTDFSFIYHLLGPLACFDLQKPTVFK
jgi:hypothetical protein